MTKTVIINRAVPGSGKTTITNCIVEELIVNDISISVHSTDEYFMVGNKYIFDIEKLNIYHQENFLEFKKSIENKIDVVICDNTNIAPWQTEVYTKLAREHQYQILIITLNIMSPKKRTNKKPF
jgi:tRNA uridine 5-carbamoylmethylation protein Kti12